MEVTVYVLHGHWETAEGRGVTVVSTELREREAVKKLAEIAETKAGDYCKLCEDKLEVEQTDRMFEMRDMVDGGFVGFYITEHKMELGGTVETLVYNRMKRQYLMDDVRNAVENAYENADISKSEYEMVKGDEVIMETIADRFEEEEDCNVAFNDTMERVTLETVGDFAACME